MPWLRILLSLALIYAAVVVVWAGFRLRPRAHRAISLGQITAQAPHFAFVFAAMLIPLDAPVARFGVAVLGIITAGRVASYWIEGGRASLRQYLSFISIAMLRPYLIYSRYIARARPHVRRETVRLLLAAAVIPIAWKLAERLILSDASQNSWLLNDVVVSAAFVIIMTCVGQCLLAVWRLQGLAIARPIVDQILASRTPADFWRRWSWPPHVYLWRYIYGPTGGKRHHVRAVMLVFLASGLAHEILFGVALGRVTGHQTLYFLISGLGVLASPALERLSRLGWMGEALMRALTLSFLAATAPLMFISFHYVTTLYVKSIWLMW